MSVHEHEHIDMAEFIADWLNDIAGGSSTTLERKILRRIPLLSADSGKTFTLDELQTFKPFNERSS